jgi:hypothetical protein
VKFTKKIDDNITERSADVFENPLAKLAVNNSLV